MISTADLQDWMKADDADAQTLRLLEEAAIKTVEQQTGRYFGVTATRTEIIRFKNWPLTLKNDPVAGAITSLSQWDGSTYALVDAANYYVEGSFIWSNASFVYPPIIPDPQRFQVIYPAGYTVDPLDADVWPAPNDIQQAVKLLVGNWFENREATVIGTITSDVKLSFEMLIAPHVRVVV